MITIIIHTTDHITIGHITGLTSEDLSDLQVIQDFHFIQDITICFIINGGITMEIREMKKEDYARVSALYEENQSERRLKFNKRQLSNYLRGSGNKIFVLREEDIMMGLLNLNHATPGVIEIKDLVIKREFRNYGYGAKLLEYAIEHAKKNNVRKLFVLTNPNLRNAYVSYGFVLEGYLRSHIVDEEDLIVMSLFLDVEKQIDLGKKLDDIKLIEEVEEKTREGLRRLAGRR